MLSTREARKGNKRFVRAAILSAALVGLGLTGSRALAGDYTATITTTEEWTSAATWDINPGPNPYPQVSGETAIIQPDGGDRTMQIDGFVAASLTLDAIIVEQRNTGQGRDLNLNGISGVVTINTNTITMRDATGVTSGAGDLFTINATGQNVALNAAALTITNTTWNDGIKFNDGNVTFTSLTAASIGKVEFEDNGTVAATWSMSGAISLDDVGQLSFRYRGNGTNGANISGTSFTTLTANAGAGNEAKLYVERATGSGINVAAFTGTTLNSNLNLDTNNAHVSIGPVTVGGGVDATLRLSDSYTSSLSSNGWDWSGVINSAAGDELTINGGGTVPFAVDNTSTLLGGLSLANVRANVTVDGGVGTGTVNVGAQGALNLSVAQTTLPTINVAAYGTITGNLTGVVYSGSGQNVFLSAGAIVDSTATVQPVAGNGHAALLGVGANSGTFVQNGDPFVGLALGNGAGGPGVSGNFNGGTLTAAVGAGGNGADLSITAVGFKVLQSATLDSDTTIANVNASLPGSGIEIDTAATAGTVTTVNVTGSVAQQNVTVLRFDDAGTLGAAQTYSVTDGRVDFDAAGAVAAGGTLNIGAGATLFLDLIPSSGNININAGGALYIDNAGRIISGPTYTMAAGSLLDLKGTLTMTSANLPATAADADWIIDNGTLTYGSNIGVKSGRRITTSSSNNATLSGTGLLGPANGAANTQVILSAAAGRTLTINSALDMTNLGDDGLVGGTGGDADFLSTLVVNPVGAFTTVTGNGNMTRVAADQTGTVNLRGAIGTLGPIIIGGGVLDVGFTGDVTLTQPISGVGTLAVRSGTLYGRITLAGDLSGFTGDIHVGRNDPNQGSTLILQSAPGASTRLRYTNHDTQILLDGISIDNDILTGQDFNDRNGPGSTGTGTSTWGGFWEGGENNTILTEGTSTFVLRGDPDGYTPLPAGSAGSPNWYAVGDVRSVAGYTGAIVSASVSRTIDQYIADPVNSPPNTHPVRKIGTGTLVFQAGFDAAAYAPQTDMSGAYIRGVSSYPYEGSTVTGGEWVTASSYILLDGTTDVQTTGQLINSVGGGLTIGDTSGGNVTALKISVTRSLPESITVSNTSQTVAGVPYGGIAEGVLEVATGVTVTHTGSLTLGVVATPVPGTLYKTGDGTYTINGTQTHAAGSILNIQAGTVNMNTDAGVPASYGLDGAPGVAGVDDDGFNGVDDPFEYGFPGSDDVARISNLTVNVTGGVVNLGVAQTLNSMSSTSPGGINLAGYAVQVYNLGDEVALNAAVGAGNIVDSTALATHQIGITDQAIDVAGVQHIRVKVTRKGDANLDGTTNFNDLLRLSQNYNLGGKLFDEADFNYDGTVNFNDLLILSQNYNQSYPSGSPAAGAAVPEPGVLGVLAMGAMGLLGRRRRS